MLCRSCYHIPLVVQRYSTRFHIKSRVWNITPRTKAEVFMWNQFIVLSNFGFRKWRRGGVTEDIPRLLKQPFPLESWPSQMPPPRTADVWLPAADCAGRSTFQAFSRTQERPPQPFDALGGSSGQILTQKNGFQLIKNTTGLSSTHLVTAWVTF